MIVREATTNIQRHSEASRASIEVTAISTGAGLPGNTGAVTLTIMDDGLGGACAEGNGLKGIAERVRSLGGSLRLDSPHGRGTVLRADLPLAGYAVTGSIPEPAGAVEITAAGIAAVEAAAASLGS